jgi:hypothetical protein
VQGQFRTSNGARLAVVIDLACGQLLVHRCGRPVTPSNNATWSIERHAVHTPNLHACSCADEHLDGPLVRKSSYRFFESNVAPRRVLEVHVCSSIQQELDDPSVAPESGSAKGTTVECASHVDVGAAVQKQFDHNVVRHLLYRCICCLAPAPRYQKHLRVPRIGERLVAL